MPAIALLCAGAAPAAEDQGPGHFLSVGIMHLQPDSGRGTDAGSGAEVSYAHRAFGERWLEARLFTTVLDTGIQNQIDFYQSGLGLDLMHPFGEQSASHFYVLGGGGVVSNNVSPVEDSGTGGFVDVAAGWRSRVWESWGLRSRLELRLVHDFFQSGQDDLVFGLTLEIPPKPERVVERTVEVEKIVEVPIEVEKIVEREVVCVIPTVEVGPADADADGVLDDKDKCPGTLKGAKVDAEGCVIKKAQSINLPNLEFEPNSAVLTEAGKEKLAPVVEFLSNQTDVQMTVVGHTDGQGGATYNQKLSEGRAEAVAEYLESRGIAHARLSSRGRGESQPIADNTTDEGRAQNRRVELRIHTK